MAQAPMLVQKTDKCKAATTAHSCRVVKSLLVVVQAITARRVAMGTSTASPVGPVQATGIWQASCLTPPGSSTQRSPCLGTAVTTGGWLAYS